MCQKILDECGSDADNSSVTTESFIARTGSCSVSPTDRTAAYWNHPGYVLRGSFRTTTARSGIRVPSGCAEICGALDECDAFSFIEDQRLCLYLVGSVDDVCAIGSLDCFYNVPDLTGVVATLSPTERPLWAYDVGGVYCAPNTMECGCTREYFQCLLQNGCEGSDDDVSSFADLCTSRGCTSDQCGLRWSKSGSFASVCSNNFFDCVVSTVGDCGCTRDFVICMDTDQDAVAIDI